MYNITNDVANVMTINNKVLEKVNAITIMCIAQAVRESMIAEEDITECDIGIGKLVISHSGNDVKFKFVPSSNLVQNVVDTLQDEESSLECNITDSLVDKLVNNYKTLLQ